jgi:DNA-binding protein H-NS
MIDLSKLDFAQLKALREQVVQQIAAIRQQEIKRVAQHIEEIAKSLDMGVAELLEESGILNPKAKSSKGKTGSGVKAPALYQNPNDASQTWSGRGRQPGWAVKHQEGGGKLDELRINP